MRCSTAANGKAVACGVNSVDTNRYGATAVGLMSGGRKLAEGVRLCDVDGISFGFRFTGAVNGSTASRTGLAFAVPDCCPGRLLPVRVRVTSGSIGPVNDSMGMTSASSISKNNG